MTAIAEALNCKICVTRDKKKILDCLEDADINKRITLSAMEAKVHVVPMKELNYKVVVVSFILMNFQ